MTHSPINTTPFLPSKEQWDKAQRLLTEQAVELAAIRAALGLAAGEEVVAVLDECRAVFDHLPGPKGETFRDLIYRIAQQQRQQANTITELKSRQEELAEALGDAINQACYDHEAPNVLDSLALTAYANAMHLLADLGKIRIIQGYGRRVIATPVAVAQPPTDQVTP